MTHLFRAWSTATRFVGVSLALLAGVASRPARAQDATPAGSASWAPQILGTQLNVIAQRLAPFHSPCDGTNSLDARGDHAVSDTYGVYLGALPFAWDDRGHGARSRVETYLDVEMVRGRGVSRTVGLAGLTNGDVIRQGSADLGNGPYVARAFVRLIHALGAAPARDTVPRAVDQLAETMPATRLELTAGKLAASDLFDVNRYANSTRTQFMNWGLFQNTAWDFAADTRGYTNGIAAAWITPAIALRVGSFQMPRKANGNVFDSDLRRARGDQAEVTVTPTLLGLGAYTPTVRVLAYVNHARMGDYRDALAIARAIDNVPDIVATDAPGRRKRGIGINAELPLADGGETGAFARWGESDGDVESFAFTEVERHLSAGVQVAGSHWGRAADRVGIGAVQHGISTAHRAYLAAGGTGFLLGDGRLSYAPETLAEAYYRVQLGAFVQVTPDLQLARNPGYNRDRGPATITGVRVNMRY